MKQSLKVYLIIVYIQAHSTVLIRVSPVVMPKGTEVISAETWGLSAWTRTAKISTILPGGNHQKYFLKVN